MAHRAKAHRCQRNIWCLKCPQFRKMNRYARDTSKFTLRAKLWKDLLRDLLNEKLGSQRIIRITSRVVWGSSLRSDFRNVSHDNLLRLHMSKDARLVSYANDVGALVAGCNTEKAQSRLAILMRRASRWLRVHDFSLPVVETIEVVILTKKTIQRLSILGYHSTWRWHFWRKSHHDRIMLQLESRPQVD